MSNDELTVWGIHTTDDSLFLNGNVVAIGWKEFGDCGELVHTREAFKAHCAEVYPNAKKGSIAVCAGMLYRFAVEVQMGDYIVFPLVLSISVDKNSPRINKCTVVKSANSRIGSIKITLAFHRGRKTADRMAYPPVVPVAHIVDPDYMLKLLDSINLTPAA